MSSTLSFPRNFARTGPKAAATRTAYSFSAMRSIDSHPGIDTRSISGSLSAVQARARSTGRRRCPESSIQVPCEVAERSEVVHRKECVDVRAHGGDARGARLEVVEAQERIQPEELPARAMQ